MIMNLISQPCLWPSETPNNNWLVIIRDTSVNILDTIESAFQSIDSQSTPRCGYQLAPDSKVLITYLLTSYNI